jgi:hypothetical protein
MPAIDIRDNRSTSEDGSSLADGSNSSHQTIRRRRPKACQCCRARKVRCKFANDGNLDPKCSASQTHHNSKGIPRPKSRLQKKEDKSWDRTQPSPSREDGQELPPEALEGLNALLHISTITANERSLLCAFLPPEPKTHLDLNAFMRGQAIPNACGHGVSASSTHRIPRNDFDVFFDLCGGSDGNRAELSPQSRSRSCILESTMTRS